MSEALASPKHLSQRRCKISNAAAKLATPLLTLQRRCNLCRGVDIFCRGVANFATALLIPAARNYDDES